jgi:hypothetical protein
MSMLVMTDTYFSTAESYLTVFCRFLDVLGKGKSHPYKFVRIAFLEVSPTKHRKRYPRFDGTTP